MKTPSILLSALMLATVDLRAQIVADGATRTLANVTNSITGDVTVGTNGSFTLLTLSDNALVTNSVNGVIGRGTTAKSNEVRLVSSTARWRMGGTLFVGSNGIASRLVVSNGALLESGSLTVGNHSAGSNNEVIVTGPGSTLNAPGVMFIGADGNANRLAILNGGKVFVTNSGSPAFVGFNQGMRNNSALVADPGSRWSVNGSLIVGSGASASTLVVSNGASVDSVNGTVGNALSASNNLAMVTDSGSTWSNSGTLRVGDIGPRNQLTVSNGGSVSVGGTAYVGLNSQSTSNRVTVDSGTLRVTNDTASGLLDVRRGTLTVNSGLVEVDQLLATNAAGFLEFNSGTLALRNSTVNSMRVGNGTNAATLLFTGNGTNNVGGVATISSNAVLAGNGQLVGALTVQPGGTISPGASIGKIDLSVTPTLQGNIHMEISKNGTTLAKDQIEMVGAVGTFNYGGTLTVTKVGPTALAAGDTFQLFPGGSYDGAFASITLPTLGAGLGWENRMNGDGSIAVANGAPGAATFFPTTIAGTSATLPGTVWPHGFNTVGWFEWGAAPVGEVPPLANMTPIRPLGGGISPTNLNETLTGLSGNAFVMFRAVASNSFGVTYGDIEFFVTRGPGVRTSPATALAVTTATLNGAVLPGGTATTAWFQWGTTTNYGNVTPLQSVGSGAGFINISNSISGLTPGVPIHYRTVASNSIAVSFGSDVSFAIAFSPGKFLSAVSSGSVAWGDYNNDGLPDLLQTGRNSPNVLISYVWRNTGRTETFETFVVADSDLPVVDKSAVAWGDYDNDGRLDILLAGADASDTPLTQVWRNTGTGFTNINAGLPGISAGSAAWGDYDNDGRLDILLAGFTTNGPITQIWRNNGGGFENINAGLPGIRFGSAAWGDYDNDGGLDILLAGITNNPGQRITQVWRNTGSGFTNINAGLPGVEGSSVAWGDYDNDGRLDILLAGYTANAPITQIWRNNGSGFNNINAGLPGISSGSAAWGDYDNDGRLDILLAGFTSGGPITQVWRNSAGGFVNTYEVLPGVGDSSVAWADLDNDGRLDFVLTGHTADGHPSGQIWRNNTAQANTPPAVPTGLSATLSKNAVVFHWNPGNDAQTPAAGLTYNLRIGTTPGGSEILAPMASSNGLRCLPAMGNAQLKHSFAMTTLPFGQPIYWSVQAVDTAFAGSAFAPEQTFTFNTVFTPTNGVPVPGDTNGDGVVDDAEFAAVLAHLHGNGVVSESNLDQVLANYFPTSPFLQMTNVAGLGGTNVTFALSNSFVGAFSVEYTTNLFDWLFLGPATPRYLFTDTNAPAIPQRHYRLRWP